MQYQWTLDLKDVSSGNISLYQQLDISIVAVVQRL